MSTASAFLAADVRFRKMTLTDLVQVRQTESLWLQSLHPGQDVSVALEAGAGIGQVAECSGHVVGFVIYRMIRESRRVDLSTIKKLLGIFLGRGASRRARGPMQIELLNVTVVPSWRRQGIGRQLLREVERQLKRPDDCVWAMVPETNLALQLLLRDSQYRAIRVVRGHYGDEDGYLMQRTHS
jgi:ribosomal protein S18 acetylase RimI-like enzyme